MRLKKSSKIISATISILGTTYLGLGLLATTIVDDTINHYVKRQIDNPKIQEKTLNPYIERPISNIALDYLNYSFSLTSKYFYNETNNSTENNLEKALENHHAVCLEKSIVTYSNFRELTKESNHPELKKDVRLVIGRATIWNKERKITGPHAWLEINLNGNWTPYETSITEFRGRLVKNKEVMYIPVGIIESNEDGKFNSKIDWINGSLSLGTAFSFN